jgi:hypothetical protein
MATAACMAHPALDNPSCQSLAARIPATCMQQLSELMIVAQSVSDRLCDDAATAPLFGPTGMVMQAVKCLVDVPEFADLVPFSNVLSRATVRRIFCDAEARVVVTPPPSPSLPSSSGPGVVEFTQVAYAVLIAGYAFFLLGKTLSKCEFH